MKRKISKFLKSVNEWLPYLIKDEMQKREVMRWLEKSLKETAAYGEEQRKGIQESTKGEIIKSLFNPEYFKGRNLPELAILNHLKTIYPELAPEVQAPQDIDQQIAEANATIAQLTKLRMAGEPVPEEILQKVSKFFGEKTLGEAATDIIKQKEGAAERAIRGGELEVEKKKVAISEKEVAARWKEIEGQVGDMTAKEARDWLFRFGTERRRYEATLSDEFLSDEERVHLNKNIREIEGKEKRIIKNNPAIRKEYEELVKELKAKGYRKEHLETNQTLVNWLIDNGYNTNVVKDFFE